MTTMNKLNILAACAISALAAFTSPASAQTSPPVDAIEGAIATACGPSPAYSPDRPNLWLQWQSCADRAAAQWQSLADRAATDPLASPERWRIVPSKVQEEMGRKMGYATAAMTRTCRQGPDPKHCLEAAASDLALTRQPLGNLNKLEPAATHDNELTAIEGFFRKWNPNNEQRIDVPPPPCEGC
jgi:hypothetical protein